MTSSLRGRSKLGAYAISLGLLASGVPAFGGGAAFAQSQPAPNAEGSQQAAPAQSTAERQQAELSAAWAAAAKVATNGPATVKLIDEGELNVPAGMAFVPSAEAARILRAYGNPSNSNPVGLLTGTGDDANWLAVIRFIKEGYIKDDDAKDWNADDLLSNLKQGNEEANEERAERGFPKLELIGWIEKPAYDASTHRLVWSLASKTEGEADEADRGVNYNTYALGRDGYFSLNMLTSEHSVEKHKPIAHELLSDLSYVPGKRYEDFNSSTDQIAAYGLAALVGGVAAKKLGLFAVILAFAAKFAKVGILALLALGASIGKFFKRKPKQVATAEAESGPASE